MYNRYIPQPDGSYRRSRMPESVNSSARTPQPRREERPVDPPPVRPPFEQECSEPPILSKPAKEKPLHTARTTQAETDGIMGFFKKLLPKDLDTADLLVILLLLLMAGEREEDRNNALLTMALYFFM